MFGPASDIPESNVITLGTSLTQSSCNRLGNTQSAVSRLGKPSGLRVPKPSIGYFSQVYYLNALNPLVITMVL